MADATSLPAPEEPQDSTLPGYKWTPETHDALLAGMPGGGINRLVQLAQGNNQLVTNPGLMDALARGNATPEQASAINNFMEGLDLEKQVKLSRASGTKLTLSDQQQTVLDQLGAHYSDVLQTPQQAQDSMSAQLAAKGLEVAKDQNGNIILDGNGQPIIQKSTSPQKKSGWSFMRVLSDVGSGLTKAWNVVDAGLSAVSNAMPGILPNQHNIDDTSANHDQEIRDAGYDPNNFFSMVAYEASGKSHLNLASLADQWDAQKTGISGKQALDEAIQFTTNPVHYRQQIENDPTLTIQQKADKLAFINSPDFVNLSQQVAGNTATIGNVNAQAAGLDPVKDGTAYTLTSAGIDFAASIALDPTILAGRAFSAARAAQVGIKAMDGSLDVNKVLAIFQPMSFADKLKQPFVAGVQRRWQNYLDLTKVVGSADKSSVEYAKAYAQINAQFPELAPLTEQMTGANQVLGFDAIGKKLITGPGKPITSLEEAGDYLTSKMALAYASQGKAALETNLMPGATSLFGYRALKGLLAGVKVGGAEKINLARLSAATSILPDAANAISEDGRVLAARDALADAQAKLDVMKGTVGQYSFAQGMSALRDVKTARLAAEQAERVTALEALDKYKAAGMVGETVSKHVQSAIDDITNGGNARDVLASAQRKAFNDPVLRGQIQQNMLRRGTVNGDGFNLLGMIQARNELVTRRLTTLLPRNTVFKLDDPQSQENIYRYAQIYMNKGDAALMAAKWAGGDEGTRRALISHLQLQTAHSAGFGYTETGRKVLSDLSDLLDNTTDAFGGAKATGDRYTGNDLDVAQDPDLGGQAAHYAVHFPQAITEWTLPSFAKMQQDANRFGLWDRILGRAFTSQVADVAMHGFKMIQLMKPSTFTRNALEGWANAVFRGDAAGGMRAKALGVEVEQRMVRELEEKAARESWTKEQLQEAIDKYSPLQRKGFLASRIPHLIMGQWYRQVLNKVMGDDLESEYITKLLNQPGEAKRMMQGYGLQHLLSDVDPAGTTSKLANYKAGFGSAELTFGHATGTGQKIESYEQAATDGFEGAQKFSRSLGIKYGSDPAYTGLLLDAAKANDGDVSPILKMIADSPTLQKKANQMRFASLFQDKTGQWVKAVTDDDKAQALEQLVRKQVDDTRYMLTGKNGKWQDDLEAKLRDGDIPDGKWINDNLKGDNRPEAVEAPVYAAVPLKQGKLGFMNGLFEKTDKAYVRLVEDPIQRTTSMPLFLHNYGVQRALFSTYEKALIEEHGFTAEAADELMKEAAMKAAWVKTEATIDDPGLKTQFDIVGRNFFAYSRAMQAMIRRWGQAMVQDPTRMVKASLAIEGAQHSGVIWTDENGEPNFTFPASGALIHLFTSGMSHLPILGGMMQIPTVPDLTGKVMLAMPGLENPFHLSATPLVNVPFRAIERLVPQHYALMDEIDRTVNGNIGAGQIASEFEPIALKKFFDAFSQDDRNGMVASATIGAITNLIAAGVMPDENTTDDERQHFIDRVRVNVRNQLFLRAIFGLWAPAAPSSPTNATSGSQADYAFQIQGIHGLSSEFKTLLNDVGGDYNTAVQLWTAMHPDKLVYTQARSHSLANKAYLPATTDAMHWVENNTGFIQKYKNIAGYFLPESSGEFNSSAYATQLAVGLRERNTPKEFLDTALVNLARPEYQKTTKQFDAEIAAAKAAGDTQSAAELTKNRAAWVANFKAANPLYKDQGAVYAVKGNTADDALHELREMVNDPTVPNDVPKQVISEMIQSWDSYQNWKAANPGNTTQEKDARTVMAAAFAQFMSAKAQEVPGLIDLYQGVFRQLDNKLIDLQALN